MLHAALSRRPPPIRISRRAHRDDLRHRHRDPAACAIRRSARLAVTTEKRSSRCRPATISEAGLAGYDANTWGGILAPAGTPGVVATLNAEINKALAAEDVRAKLVANGIDIQGSTPERFGEYIKAEVEKWTKVTKDAGIEPE
jgi:tripartite-type tricarboxylate transporter receptor subunit TctC